MKEVHTPQVEARYWTGILLASVAGTNLGDLYAHESGLGIAKGLGLLAVLVAGVFLLEARNTRRIEVYYWAVILLIRTGATNIADWLAYRVRVPETLLVTVLTVLLICLAAGTRHRVCDGGQTDLPQTGVMYWLTMLAAGIFGTVVGDICERRMGEGGSALGLATLLLAVLLVERHRAATVMALYWITVAVARTAGTAVGDWVAENKVLPVGLPIATLLSTFAFVLVLLFWRSRARADSMHPVLATSGTKVSVG